LLSLILAVSGGVAQSGTVARTATAFAIIYAVSPPME